MNPPSAGGTDFPQVAPEALKAMFERSLKKYFPKSEDKTYDDLIEQLAKKLSQGENPESFGEIPIATTRTIKFKKIDTSKFGGKCQKIWYKIFGYPIIEAYKLQKIPTEDSSHDIEMQTLPKMSHKEMASQIREQLQKIYPEIPSEAESSKKIFERPPSPDEKISFYKNMAMSVLKSQTRSPMYGQTVSADIEQFLEKEKRKDPTLAGLIGEIDRETFPPIAESRTRDPMHDQTLSASVKQFLEEMKRRDPKLTSFLSSIDIPGVTSTYRENILKCMKEISKSAALPEIMIDDYTILDTSFTNALAEIAKKDDKIAQATDFFSVIFRNLKEEQKTFLRTYFSSDDRIKKFEAMIPGFSLPSFL